MKNRNIFHINSYYQAGKFYKHLYEEQVKQGLGIRVFVPVSAMDSGETFQYGNYSTLVPTHRSWERVFFYHKHKKILKEARKAFQKSPFDLIHAHSLFSNGYVAMKLKEETGTPYVVAVRNADVNFFFEKMIHLRILGRKILKEADGVVFLSQAYKEQVLSNWVPKSMRKDVEKKSWVIPNGIDPFWFEHRVLEAKSMEPMDLPKIRELRMIAVGDLDENKNSTSTVEAIRLLEDQGLKVTLTAIGRIKDPKVYQIIKDCPFVIYKPYMTKDELVEEYRNSHLFVLPSIHETFGLVYGEAMSQGLPVLYSKNQGFDSQFPQGDVGYAVEAKNPEDIARCTKEILGQYSEISQRCIQRVERFQWSVIAQTYSRFYDEIFGVPRNGGEPTS